MNFLQKLLRLLSVSASISNAVVISFYYDPFYDPYARLYALGLSLLVLPFFVWALFKLYNAALEISGSKLADVLSGTIFAFGVLICLLSSFFLGGFGASLCLFGIHLIYVNSEKGQSAQ